MGWGEALYFFAFHECRKRRTIEKDGDARQLAVVYGQNSGTSNIAVAPAGVFTK